MRFQHLADWLSWQQSLHPRAIDLGLERVRAVADRLGVLAPGCPVITVGGTNGKGSCVALLEAILTAAGYRVGSYTSPHLLRYNERIRIGGQEAGDADLVQAFDRVDRARGEQSLSYFEFGTLAALDLFRRGGCAVLLLEVGLGGRLDAVNIIDADVALISSVGLDHTDWLGPDREAIGYEKAGIFRRGRPAVFGQPDVPASVLRHARDHAVPLRVAGLNYGWQHESDSGGWSFRGEQWQLSSLPPPALAGEQQYANAAAVLAALEALEARLPVPAEALRQGLQTVRLAGRFQRLQGPVEWIFDVAHNADSVNWLAQALAQRPIVGQTIAVFGQLQRKELRPAVEPLAALVDRWLLLRLPDADARDPEEVEPLLGELVGAERLAGVVAPEDLRQRVAALAAPGDRVLVFGSFRTVEEGLRGAAAAAAEGERGR